MQYEARKANSGWLIVNRTEPSADQKGVASMFKTVQYLKDNRGRIRRFGSEESANAFIERLLGVRSEQANRVRPAL